MNYRIAKLEDARELDNLLTKLIDDERTKYDNSIEPMLVQDFYKNELLHDNKRIYLCEDKGRIVGYIYIIIDNEGVARIDALYVEEDYRHRSIASNLLEKSLEWLKEEQIKRVEISVLSENVAAKKLYEKHGFEVFKETLKIDLQKSK